MTKTLTEQWREGTLSMGYYYVSKPTRYGGEAIKYLDDDCSFGLAEDIIQEVLAPVLPYRVLYDKDQGIFPVLNIVLRNIEREQCRRKLTDLELSIKSQVKGVLAFNGLARK